MTKELLQHRIDRCEKAIKSYPCYLDMKKILVIVDGLKAIMKEEKKYMKNG